MGATLPDLPSCPPDKRGWPWYQPTPASVSSHSPPRISIVTPSYNQERFIEETIRSVLLQQWPNLEYIIIEDGSTDTSPAAIRKYEPWLAKFVTGPNRGFGEAVNAGLQMATGDIMAYLNSDDFYLPGAFETVARVFRDCPEVEWVVGASWICSSDSQPFAINSCRGYSRKLFYSGRYLGGHPAWSGQWIPQESVFWRRSLWQKAGGSFLRERLQYGDFEMWSRFWQHADLHFIPVTLAAYRCHAATYTSRQGNRSLEPCTRLIEAASSDRLSPGAIRLRSVLCRASERLSRTLGEPAKYLAYDTASGKWKVAETHVM